VKIFLVFEFAMARPSKRQKQIENAREQKQNISGIMVLRSGNVAKTLFFCAIGSWVKIKILRL
jgi:hypothetical protein